MSDIDITERLRHKDLFCQDTDPEYQHEVVFRAADEIERLRARIAELEREYKVELDEDGQPSNIWCITEEQIDRAFDLARASNDRADAGGTSLGLMMLAECGIVVCSVCEGWGTLSQAPTGEEPCPACHRNGKSHGWVIGGDATMSDETEHLCMWCGHDDVWFDRTLVDFGDGPVMHYICSGCARPQLNPKELSRLWDGGCNPNDNSLADNQRETKYIMVLAPAVATLSFDMTDPDGQRHHRDALQGTELRCALWQYDNKLRSLAKYGTEHTAYEGKDPEEIFQMLRELLYTYLDDYGVRLDEE